MSPRWGLRRADRNRIVTWVVQCRLWGSMLIMIHQWDQLTVHINLRRRRWRWNRNNFPTKPKLCTWAVPVWFRGPSTEIRRTCTLRFSRWRWRWTSVGRIIWNWGQQIRSWRRRSINCSLWFRVWSNSSTWNLRSIAWRKLIPSQASWRSMMYLC